MKMIKKGLLVIFRFFIKKLIYVNVDLYMKLYMYYLKKIGVQIHGSPKFISNDVYFDGNNYSKIQIGDNVTISKEVMLLTHDYSITNGFASLGNVIKRHEGELYFSKEIIIGNNTFIGARSSILPGTIIGDNVIIGACSVVKGEIPSDSIVIGNPCKVISSTEKWTKKQIELNEFLIEER